MKKIFMEKYEKVFNHGKVWNVSQFMEKYEMFHNSWKSMKRFTIHGKVWNDSWRIQTRGQALKLILSLVVVVLNFCKEYTKINGTSIELAPV